MGDRPFPFSGAALGMSFVSALLLGQAFSSRLNTLENNGRWTSTKSTVEYLNGASHFFSGRQALNRNRLNLGAWHGFQEVVYRDPLTLRRLDFRFRFSEGYFYALFHKIDDGFSGIRVSVNPLYEPLYFTAEDSGKFTRKEPFALDPSNLSTDAWNSCRILFSSTSVSLFLNGRLVRSFDSVTDGPGRFGFRGSSKEVLIDDIEARTEDGDIVRESFFNAKSYLLFSATAFLVLVALQFWFHRYLRRHGDPAPSLRNRLLLFNARALVVSLVLWGFLPFWDARYPSTSGFLRRLERQERDFLDNAPRLINEEIMEIYGKAKAPGVFRICFFGTSQTGGAGARNRDDTFVRQLESRLNRARDGAAAIECLNPSAGGGTIPRMLPYYEKFWTTLGLDLTVVNLSTNDDPSTFEKDLQRIADINAERGIKTLFVMEGNSPEFPTEYASLSAKHAAMERVGKINDIPVLNAHAHLYSRKDDGILWWDIVHLTSFGHALMADFLFENLKTSLEFMEAPGSGKSR